MFEWARSGDEVLWVMAFLFATIVRFGNGHGGRETDKSDPFISAKQAAALKVPGYFSATTITKHAKIAVGWLGGRHPDFDEEIEIPTIPFPRPEPQPSTKKTDDKKPEKVPFVTNYGFTALQIDRVHDAAVVLADGKKRELQEWLVEAVEVQAANKTYGGPLVLQFNDEERIEWDDRMSQIHQIAGYEDLTDEHAILSILSEFVDGQDDTGEAVIPTDTTQPPETLSDALADELDAAKVPSP